VGGAAAELRPVGGTGGRRERQQGGGEGGYEGRHDGLPAPDGARLDRSYRAGGPSFNPPVRRSVFRDRPTGGAAVRQPLSSAAFAHPRPRAAVP